MKTAMQELLENLQKSFDEKTYPIKIDGTYFLEKEKEQIINAFEQGLEFGLEFGFPTNCSNYFNKTYNQNK